MVLTLRQNRVLAKDIIGEPISHHLDGIERAGLRNHCPGSGFRILLEIELLRHDIDDALLPLKVRIRTSVEVNQPESFDFAGDSLRNFVLVDENLAEIDVADRTVDRLPRLLVFGAGLGHLSKTVADSIIGRRTLSHGRTADARALITRHRSVGFVVALARLARFGRRIRGSGFFLLLVSG